MNTHVENWLGNAINQSSHRDKILAALKTTGIKTNDIVSIKNSEIISGLSTLSVNGSTKKAVNKILENYNSLIIKPENYRDNSSVIFSQGFSIMQTFYRDFLKGSEGLSELEKKGNIKVTRDGGGKPISIDTSNINPTFSIQGIDRYVFLNTLIGGGIQIKSDLEIESILEDFFKVEFNIASENITTKKSIARNYLKSKEGLKELEDECEITIEYDDQGNILSINLDDGKYRKSKLNNTSVVEAFIKHLTGIPDHSRRVDDIVSSLKKFFNEEFSLTEVNFITLKEDYKKIYESFLKTDEGLKEFKNKSRFSIKRESSGKVTGIGFSNMYHPSNYSIECQGKNIPGITFIKRLKGGKFQESITIQETILILKEFFTKAYGIEFTTVNTNIKKKKSKTKEKEAPVTTSKLPKGWDEFIQVSGIKITRVGDTIKDINLLHLKDPFDFEVGGENGDDFIQRITKSSDFITLPKAKEVLKKYLLTLPGVTNNTNISG